MHLSSPHTITPHSPPVVYTSLPSLSLPVVNTLITLTLTNGCIHPHYPHNHRLYTPSKHSPLLTLNTVLIYPRQPRHPNHASYRPSPSFTSTQKVHHYRCHHSQHIYCHLSFVLIPLLYQLSPGFWKNPAWPLAASILSLSFFFLSLPPSSFLLVSLVFPVKV